MKELVRHDWEEIAETETIGSGGNDSGNSWTCSMSQIYSLFYLKVTVFTCYGIIGVCGLCSVIFMAILRHLKFPEAVLSDFWPKNYLRD